MTTRVVNIRTSSYDVYMGRRPGQDLHYGNPFAHTNSSYAKVRVQTRTEAVEEFHAWITGARHHDLEPERRQWILDTVHTLKDKTLGCFCKPATCHVDILARMADGPVDC